MIRERPELRRGGGRRRTRDRWLPRWRAGPAGLAAEPRRVRRRPRRAGTTGPVRRGDGMERPIQRSTGPAPGSSAAARRSRSAGRTTYPSLFS